MRTLPVWCAVVAVTVGSFPTLALSRQQPGSATRVRISPLIDRLERGLVAIGGETWSMIDAEHAPYLLDQIRAKLDGISQRDNGQLDITPLVRIPIEGDDSPTWMVKQVLDAGAMGIVFPAINTKAQAQRAIASMRYPHQRGVPEYPHPVGFRAGAPRGGKFLNSLEPAELLRRADVWPLNPNGELFAMLMVEKPEGVKNINDILDVPGIGAILVGTSDLAMSYGEYLERPKNALSPDVARAVDTVLKACLAKKVICAIPDRTGDRENLIKRGFRVFL